MLAGICALTHILLLTGVSLKHQISASLSCCESFPLCSPALVGSSLSGLSLSLLWIFPLGRGLKIGDILKDDEVLTAFLLRDAGLSESIVYQLVNAKIRLEQVRCGALTGKSKQY